MEIESDQLIGHLDDATLFAASLNIKRDIYIFFSKKRGCAVDRPLGTLSFDMWSIAASVPTTVFTTAVDAMVDGPMASILAAATVVSFFLVVAVLAL